MVNRTFIDLYENKKSHLTVSPSSFHCFTGILSILSNKHQDKTVISENNTEWSRARSVHCHLA